MGEKYPHGVDGRAKSVPRPPPEEFADSWRARSRRSLVPDALLTTGRSFRPAEQRQSHCLERGARAGEPCARFERCCLPYLSSRAVAVTWCVAGLCTCSEMCLLRNSSSLPCPLHVPQVSSIQQAKRPALYVELLKHEHCASLDVRTCTR